MKIILTIIVALLAFVSMNAQVLTYKSGGRVYDANNKKLAPSEVRSILSTKPDYLDYYTAGRDKKSIGNTFLIAGTALVVTDVATGLFKDVRFPSALTYIGAACFVVAIPTKIGYSRSIRKAIDGFNKKEVSMASKIEAVDVCVNQNGVGFRITY